MCVRARVWLQLCWRVRVLSATLASRTVCLVDDGWLHKAVEVKGHLHIIEELQLFEEPQPVDSLVISSTLVQ